MSKQYEMVIGLEVHAELSTETKIFCGCKVAFGAAPNTNCCPTCCGFPGTLPVLNEQVVRYAIMAGLATNCHIAPSCRMDRKNYFYPDLPKAYQISQFDQPLCEKGYLDIKTENGEKRVGITRIHIEEDAGKLLHVERQSTFVDYNRSGVPLIEIVSEPDLRSAAEAKAYLQKLRAILRYIGVSNAKMNEGSFRCDVNLSIRPVGSGELGTRTEMKNLNSFQSVQRAIEREFARQVEAVETGEAILQQTRRYDQQTGETYAMRDKENADDYRYFPDPNLPRIGVAPALVNEIKKMLPMLPDERKRVYTRDYGIVPLIAEQLILRREVAELFERVIGHTDCRAEAANLVAAHIAPLMEEEIEPPKINVRKIAAIARMLREKTITARAARELVKLVLEEDADPEAVVKDRKWARIQDEETLLPLVEAVVSENELACQSYRQGKKNAFNALMKAMLDKTQGQGDPAAIRQLLLARLEQ